jgi:hypothetical protein
LAQAAAGSSLIEPERDLLREVLLRSPEVVHLQSGHGLDDIANPDPGHVRGLQPERFTNPQPAKCVAGGPTPLLS